MRSCYIKEREGASLLILPHTPISVIVLPRMVADFLPRGKDIPDNDAREEEKPLLSS